MLKTALLALAVTSLAFVDMAAARDLTGEYEIEGTNPGGQGKYKGRVALANTGETYQVAWIVGNSRQLGTGILTGDVFSVVFRADEKNLGVAVYKVTPDGRFDGRWTGIGGKQLGTESWHKPGGI